MELQAFLEGLVAGSAGEVAAAAVAVGILVFALIESVDVAVRRKNSVGLNSDLKFWTALVLSFGVPLGAYSGLQVMNNARIELNGLFLACGVGYAASQIVHRGVDVIKAKVAENEEKAREEEIKVLSKAGTPALPIAPAAPRFDDTDYSNSGDALPFPDGERGPSGGL